MTARVWPVAAVAGAPAYDGRSLRQTTVAPFLVGATAARPFAARSGVRPGTSATTVTATSTTWTVGEHAGVIDAESAAEAGPYAYSFDANVTGSMTAASASYARIDRISVQISDPAETDGSSVPSVTIVYTPGTAAAPALPTAPPRSFDIAQINVPISGGGGPSVSWVAPYLTAAGGIIPVRTQAERDAITIATADFPVYVDRKDTGTIERNVGSGWVEFAAPRAFCRVTRSSIQALTSGSVTSVIFDATDTHGSPSSMWSSGAPTQIVTPWAGRWTITANVAFDVNATGFRLAYISAGGTRIAEELVGANPVAAGPTTLSMAATVWLPASTAVVLNVLQNSGGSLNIITSELVPALNVVSA